MKLHQLSFITLVLLSSSAQAFDLGGLKEQLGKAVQTPAQPAAAPTA
ncbi:MAG: DUF4197 domain-containing protein, partial [Gallionellales bacterium CG_4_9_14_0_8_um_filter_55_61]